jgi:diguanylate cyclase (GGDEF)-like protein/PAS domain S-box-containing protein
LEDTRRRGLFKDITEQEKKMSLEVRVTFERILTNLLTQFVDPEFEEVDEGINNALQTIGQDMGVDRGFIYLLRNDKKSFTRTHMWCSDKSKSAMDLPGTFPTQHFPGMERLRKGETLHISRLTQLPPEAKVEKEILQQCQSVILVPMLHRKLLIGFLGFDSGRVEKTWPDEITEPLKTVGKFFIIALQRRWTEEELRKSEQKYRNLVENINEVIFSLDPRGCLTYISPMIQQVAFYTPEEMIGQPCTRFIYPEDVPEFLMSLKRALAGNLEPYEFRILSKQGSVLYVHLSIRRVLEGDEPAGFTGLLIDITNQKLGEVLLDRAETKYRSIFANAAEGIFQSTTDGKFIVANPACARILGYASAEELILNDPDGQRGYFVDPIRYKEIQGVLEDHGAIQGYEVQLYRKDGSKIWVSLNARAIRNANGELLFHEGTIQDITERKRAEDQIQYLSFHDKLTGLYNRAYFEEEIFRLDTERHLPLSIVMGDVNGLKLINDAFGHQEGDKVISQVAKILKESCRKEDVIARWGGDEFSIFLPRTNYGVTSEVIDRIKIACGKASRGPVKFSIALGAGTKDGPSQDIQKVLREAEERMYRNKLLESRSVRNSIISSLRRTLFEKSHETEEHTHRLQQLSLEFGLSLGLTDGEMDDLALLATLHDLGKIAIPEGIILHPGNLSREEWELIWKHPEVGYRIARSSPELAPIAEAILSHHEWWDGSGYPRGLEGEDIPLISRIIAIVDAYDVMTYGRLYKKPLNRQETLQQLQKNAGSQFDPNLIDIFIKIVERLSPNSIDGSKELPADSAVLLPIGGGSSSQE